MNRNKNQKMNRAGEGDRGLGKKIKGNIVHNIVISFQN